MLIWDLNTALSTEAPALFALGQRLSETRGFQRLCDDKLAPEVLASHVRFGPHYDPWQNNPAGTATIAQLEQILCLANVHPAFNNPHNASEPAATSSCVDEGGTFEITLRKQVRKAELQQPGGEQAVYLAFVDCYSSIILELAQLSADGAAPRLRDVRASEPPGFGSFDTESAQGVWMGGTIEGDWGDRGAGGGE